MLTDLAMRTDVVLAELLSKQVLLLGAVLPRVGVRGTRHEADLGRINIEAELLFCPRAVSRGPGHPG